MTEQTFDYENERRGSLNIMSNSNANNYMSSSGRSLPKVARPQQHYTIENSKNLK